MSKKTKIYSRLFDIPSDCWSVITSYFSSSKDAFRIMLVSKKLNSMFHIRNIRFFENVLFKLKTGQDKPKKLEKQISLIDRFEIGKKKSVCFSYVNKLSIWIIGMRRVFYSSRSYDESLFSKSNTDQNTKNLVSLISLFPRISHLKINSPFEDFRHLNSFISKTVRQKEDSYPVFRSKVFEDKIFSERLNTLHINSFTGIDETRTLLCKLKKFRNLRVLILENIVCCDPFYPEFDSKLEELKNLKRLCLKNVYGANSLLESHDSLEVLELLDYFLGEEERYNNTIPKCSFPNLKSFIYTEKEKGQQRIRRNNTMKRIPFVLPLKNCQETLEKISLQFYQPYFGRKFLSEKDKEKNDEILSLCKNLQEIKISGENNFIGNFLCYCRKIKKLDLSSECKVIEPEKITGDSKWENITYLDISRKENLSTSRKDSKIYEKFLKRFPCLENLVIDERIRSISSWNSITPQHLFFFNTLKYLSLVNCNNKEINEEYIKTLFKNNPKLEKIRIYNDYCIKRSEDLKFSAKKVNVLKHTFEASDCGEGEDWEWFVPDNLKIMKKRIKKCKSCRMYIRPFKCGKCKGMKCVCEGSWCYDCCSRTRYKENYCKECDKVDSACIKCGKIFCYKCLCFEGVYNCCKHCRYE